MSSTSLRSRVPVKYRKHSDFLVLFLVIVVLSFGVSYVLTKTLGSKGGSVTSQILTEKNGKPVYEIRLNKDNDQPINLIVKKGEYVQFNSVDGGQHQVVQGTHHSTEHAKQALDSTVFNSDEGYLVEFKKSGTYEFHDNYDHDYTMTIIVYEPGADTTIR